MAVHIRSRADTQPCMRCKDLGNSPDFDEEMAKNDGRHSLTIKIDDLDSTCGFCSALLQMTEYFAPRLEQVESAALIDIRFDYGKAASVGVYDYPEDFVGMRTRADFYISLEAPSLRMSSLGCLDTYSKHSGSDHCFEFIQRKMKNCLDDHQACRSSGVTEMPRRLLHIGTRQSSRIKLIETVNLKVKHKYATLSHRWSIIEPMKTTTNILKVFQYSGVAWDKLPIVFQDAIQVCRRLGLQFLWIDALCIMQDSEADWERESSRMGDYYLNAHINISAAKSSHCQESFLCLREEKFLPKSFDVYLPDSSKVELIARLHTDSSLNPSSEDFGPLARRAWVYQETLLPRRIVHFTQNDLIWVCRSELCCEDGTIPLGFTFLRLTQVLSNEPQPATPFNIWNDVIEGYSVREITYDTDRLPALSGVASQINQRLNAQYIAGMWRQNLHADLCWSIDGEQAGSLVPRPISSSYIAPSWAWPSVQEPISCQYQDPQSQTNPLVTIEDVNWQVPGLNPYGKVTSGEIILYGKLTYLMIKAADPKNRYTYIVWLGPDIFEPFFPDCALVESNRSLRRAYATDELKSFAVSSPCMLLGTVDSDEECTANVMVLGSVQAGKYARVGMLMLDDASSFEGASRQAIHVV